MEFTIIRSYSGRCRRVMTLDKDPVELLACYSLSDSDSVQRWLSRLSSGVNITTSLIFSLTEPAKDVDYLRRPMGGSTPFEL